MATYYGFLQVSKGAPDHRSIREQLSYGKRCVRAVRLASLADDPLQHARPSSAGESRIHLDRRTLPSLIRAIIN